MAGNDKDEHTSPNASTMTSSTQMFRMWEAVRLAPTASGTDENNNTLRVVRVFKGAARKLWTCG